MAITREEIRHVARLARLEINEAELEALSAQVDRIIDYINMISNVATEDVEPMAHAIELSNALRDDRLTNGDGVEPSLANAPEAFDNMFCVPKVIE